MEQKIRYSTNRYAQPKGIGKDCLATVVGPMRGPLRINRNKKKGFFRAHPSLDVGYMYDGPAFIQKPMDGLWFPWVYAMGGLSGWSGIVLGYPSFL